MKQPLSPRVTALLCALALSFAIPAAAVLSGEGEMTPELYYLMAENDPPVAEDLTLTTYKNVEVAGTFAGVDPEGDLLTFRLVSKPARGSVTQSEEGSADFVYTPYENKTGKDAFTYVAVDALGNTSPPATVSIRIEKQKTKVTYSDMAGVEGHREAIHLAEAGLLVGEQMGEGYFFHPQQTMSRAQFTALTMAAVGVEAMEDVTLTGFADDGAISVWAKPYVSSALAAGLVQGTLDEAGEVVFRADAPITAAQAAVLLDRALNITDVSDVFSAAAPAWCSQSVSNLNSCGVYTGSDTLTEPLTRAQAAVMLSGALDVLEAREANSWFPW